MKPKTTAILSVGGAVAAFFGSCCALPLTLIALGLGGASFAATIAPYRWLFLILAVVMFGLAFNTVYEKKGQPASGATCSPRSYRITKIILWISMGLTLLFFVGPSILATITP